jgi:hypothetical protein
MHNIGIATCLLSCILALSSSETTAMESRRDAMLEGEAANHEVVHLEIPLAGTELVASRPFLNRRLSVEAIFSAGWHDDSTIQTIDVRHAELCPSTERCRVLSNATLRLDTPGKYTSGELFAVEPGGKPLRIHFNFIFFLPSVVKK